VKHLLKEEKNCSTWNKELLADTKTAKNLPQEIVWGKFASNRSQ